MSLTFIKQTSSPVQVTNQITGLNATHKLCSEYRQAKGAGSTIKPNEHAFYLNFTKDMTRRFEKTKHENGFM